MAFKLALLDDYQGIATTIVPWDDVSGLEVTAFSDHVDDEDALVARLEPFDGVMAMRERTAFPASVLQRLPNLRLLVTTGPFNAAIDMEAASARDVVVCGTGGTGAPTAELTWGLILGLARDIPWEHESIRSGGWQRSVGIELEGRTLGVLGLGNLGRRVTKVGNAFGMNVLAWSHNMTAEIAADAGATLTPFEELLQASDFVTIHLRLSDRTRGLIGARELELIGPQSFLVNTSRGPIVDEDALAKALENGTIAGAGLDAYSHEPLAPDHPFRRVPHLLTTPHIGYVSDACYRAFYDDALDDVRAFLVGSPVRVIKL